ncbi:MAG: RNA methyltransferase [Alphaproteobacteria bacterium]|nr:RNA methyltransferase [Alphaproteobacteria bacterium]
MSTINLPVIILVETQLPENLGSVARAMANFGLIELRLVNPKVDKKDPKAVAMAVGADAILEKAVVFSALSEAISDLTHVFATTAAIRQMVKRCYTPKTCVSLCFQNPSWKVGLLFGPERTGLSNEDISLCYGVVHIPVQSDFSSLNLGQALVILAYEYYLEKTKPIEQFLQIGETIPAPLEQVQYFLSNLEEKLDQTHFWRADYKKPIMWRNLKNIFTRMDLTQQEVRTLNGVLDFLSKKREL